MYNLKDNVKGNSTFHYFRDNALWYMTEEQLLFPVPIEDIGTATFKNVEKSLLLMRWIRRYINDLQTS